MDKLKTLVAISLIASAGLFAGGCEGEEDTPPPAPVVKASSAQYTAVMQRFAAACAEETKGLKKACSKSGFGEADRAAYWKAHNDRMAAMTEISNVLRGKGVRKAVSDAFDQSAREASIDCVTAAGEYSAAKKAGTAADLGKNPSPPPAGSTPEAMLETSTWGQWGVSQRKK